MLCLTRYVHDPAKGKPDDSRIVLILPDGREITLTLLTADRGRARIGVQADRDITILRGELLAPPS